MKTKNINEQLLEAYENGELDRVKYLLTSPELTEHADLHHQDKDGDIALMLVCRYGHLNIVKYLLTSPILEEHANINSIDKDDWNALMYACRFGHLDIVKYLCTSPELKERANINCKEKNGWNTLMWACQSNYFNIVSYLLIEQNMYVDNQTIDWLKEKNHTVLINIRNLHHNLQDKLEQKNNIQRKKI